MGRSFCKNDKCGIEVIKKGLSFCSRSCSNVFRHKTGNLKGGQKKSLFELWKEKFGIDEAIRRENAKNEKHSQSISGSRNHFYGKDHSEDFKAKSSKIHKGKSIPKHTRELMSQTHVRNIAEGLTKDPGRNFSKSGWYLSLKTNENEFYSSSYELTRMKFLDNSQLVKSWSKKHKIVLPYLLDGFTKHYHPDFLIEMVDGSFRLEEIKGWIRKEDEESFKMKNIAAHFFCKEKGWKFFILYKDNLESF